MEDIFLQNVKNRQKQTVCFTIKYSQEHPIAVNDFTQALDGLNQMYNIYVNNQLGSEEFMNSYERVLNEVWEEERKKNGLIWEEDLKKEWRRMRSRNRAELSPKDWIAKQRRRWVAEHLGKFYIEEIRQGSIIGILSDPSTLFAAVGFVGSIASIISLFKSGKRDEMNINSKNRYKINAKNVTIINNVYNLTQLPKYPGQSISIKDSQEEVEIDYNDKRLIEDRYRKFNRYFYHHNVTYREVWIQIEKGLDGDYYGRILHEPLMKHSRLPIDIRVQYLEDDISHLSPGELSDIIYQVDMDLEMYNPYWLRNQDISSKGIIYHVYNKIPIDVFID